MGFDMLRGSHTVAQAPPESGDAGVHGSLVPLLMFAAGPGTITAVVTLAAVHTPDGLPMTAIIAAVVGAGDGARARTASPILLVCNDWIGATDTARLS